eukprot:m.55392 g.55392  ORF g.55392 m.55392 type:complete len:216 (-) comp18627_c0_seq1:24-671(-)
MVVNLFGGALSCFIAAYCWTINIVPQWFGKIEIKLSAILSNRLKRYSKGHKRHHHHHHHINNNALALVWDTNENTLVLLNQHDNQTTATPLAISSEEVQWMQVTLQVTTSHIALQLERKGLVVAKTTHKSNTTQNNVLAKYSAWLVDNHPLYLGGIPSGQVFSHSIFRQIGGGEQLQGFMGCLRAVRLSEWLLDLSSLYKSAGLTSCRMEDLVKE